MPQPSHQRLTRIRPAGTAPGPRIRIGRVLLAVGFLLAALMAPAAAAVADDLQQVKLSLKPVDQTGSYFALTMDPGQSRQLKVELGNHGTSAIAARTYAADVYSIINGGFGAKDRDSTPTGTTSWLSYPGQVLQLPAGQASIRSFTVTVPPGTAPGEYVSSLILENDAPLQGSGSVALNQIVRQAIAVSIRVPGPLQPAFGFGQAEHKITAEHSVVDIGITNTGNANLKPAGNLSIRDHNGKTVAQAPVTMDSVYAHSDTKVETTLGGKLQPGNYTASITLTDPTTKTTATGTDLPFTVADTPLATTGNTAQAGQLPQILQDAGTGTTPYLIGAALLAVLAVLAALFLLRRNRNPRRGRTASPTRRRRRARGRRPAEHLHKVP